MARFNSKAHRLKRSGTIQQVRVSRSQPTTLCLQLSEYGVDQDDDEHLLVCLDSQPPISNGSDRRKYGSLAG